ncbi:kelch-like protein 18 [Phymastichus coffea]|uniref:kelch-like protein 18 n=1 Tax=Phymastichus coffea TaxID=108790 RepID=UPI00273A79E4|nr:kelch-like protein 18 [Phymastichus coffea]
MEAQRCLLFKNPNHLTNLNNMRLSGKLCDVIIKVKDKEFPSHKVILAANLKYFETMFLNSFQESKLNVVNMQDVEEAYLEAFISFAYTGEIILTDINALGLLEVANYLGEEGIKESCIELLKMHLRKEEAYKAYKLANLIGCCSLKNAATQTILSYFKDCSQTTEFFNLDFENLKDILSNASLDFAQSQRIFFESIISWILHDSTNRRIHMNTLLNIIETMKLNTDYLLNYLCKNIVNQDYRDIIKDIMSYYDEKNQETQYQAERLTQRLMIIGSVDKKLQLQYYDFTERKWSRLHEIIFLDKLYCRLGIILNDKFYYTIEDSEQSTKTNLQVFNPITKQNTMLTSDINSFSGKALCTCGKFLYFCGGRNDDRSTSDEILAYDPQTNSVETLPPMTVVRSFPAAIFYQGSLHILGGMNKLSCYNSVEKYDSYLKKWTDLPSMLERRFYHAVAVLDGKLYACGGGCTNSVEVYDPLTNRWELVASMKKDRDKFLVIAHEGKLFAIGGDGDYGTVEVYDPTIDEWQIDHELSSSLQIANPQGGLISSSYDN